MNIRYLLTGIVLAAVLVGGVFWLKQRHPVSSPSANTVENAKAKGPQNAAIQIVEYSDFQCPACQRSSQSLQQILQRFGEKTNVTFRHFPLPSHLGSPLAHQAAECAHQQHKFWDYHDRLFAEQNKWAFSPNPFEIFLTYAKDFGLNLDTFAACIADPKIRERILAEKAEGEKLQIQSTPTFFINGQRVVGAVELEKKIEEITGERLSPAAPLQSAAPASVPAPVQ